MGLHILQWNASSFRLHALEFRKYIDDLDYIPDIICVQETNLKEELTFKFFGYNVLRRDRSDGTCTGGVIILIRKEIVYSTVKIFKDIEGISVIVNTDSGSLEIINVYLPNSLPLLDKVLFDIFNKERVLICGDFNAKSTVWGSEVSDFRGKRIERILYETDKVVLNTGLPTRIHSGGESHIDLAFTDPIFAPNVIWDVLEDTCGSDHNLISMAFQCKVLYEELASPRWIFKKAQWDQFSTECDFLFSNIDWSSNDLESLNVQISESIMEAAEQYIPKSKGKHKNKSVAFWTDECSEVIKNREKAKRKARASRRMEDFLEYKRCKGLVTKIIRATRRNYWRKFSSTLSSRTKLNKVWKVIKNLSNSKAKECIPDLKIGNEFTNSQEEKANVLASHFAKVSSDSNYSDEFQQHKADFEKENEDMFTFSKCNDKVFNSEFSMAEFKYALKKCKNGSPGKDGLMYEMFRHLSVECKQKILWFFNKIWATGFIPSFWRHAIVVPILKPNKAKSAPASYRPIALTSNLCKLMERMIVRRLNWFMEKHGLINIHQAGFRKQRSTMDHLLRLSDDIVKAIGNKAFVLGVFLDFEKAYDMIWRKGMLFKLSKLGIDGCMFNWISNFLSRRSIQVRIGGTFSNELEVENGVPQGSVISPLLFLIAINDLIPSQVKYSIFADDTALWIRGKNIESIVKKMQEALNSLSDWCNKWGFKLSVDKSNAILFHRKKQTKFVLKLNGQPMTQKDKVKFLGMWFDRRLSWKHHIDYILERCLKRINILKCLAGTKWGTDKETMLIVYKAIIRSVIDYGSEVYDSAAKTNLEKLDRIQSKCLRLCSGALRCTSIAALEVDCGTPPLKLRRFGLQLRLGIRYTSLEKRPTAKCFEICSDTVYGRYKGNFKPILAKIDEDLEDLKIENSVSCWSNIPFWEINDLDVNLQLNEQICKSTDSPGYMAATTRAFMVQWSNHMSVFTDGSKCDEITGCGFFIPVFKMRRGIRLSNNSSVFDAELMAIVQALYFMGDNPPVQMVIYSDSQSALMALNSDSDSFLVAEIRYLYYIYRNRGSLVSFVWIPSHIGIGGNENADKIAKSALKHKSIDVKVPLSLKCAGKNADQIVLKKWQEMWDKETKGRFYYKIEPEVSFKVKFSCKIRSKQTCLTRLRLGKGLLNDTLCIYRIRGDNLCDFCYLKEDVSHFLMDCVEFDQFQEELVSSMLKKGVKVSVQSLLTHTDLLEKVWTYVGLTKRVI